MSARKVVDSNFLLLLILNLAVQEVFLHLIPGTVTTNTSFCRCPSTLSGKHSSFTIAFQSRLVWFKIYIDTEYTWKIGRVLAYYS